MRFPRPEVRSAPRSASLAGLSAVESANAANLKSPAARPASMQDGLSFPVSRGKDRGYRPELNEFTGTSRPPTRPAAAYTCR